MPQAKPELRRLAATLAPRRRPGDYAQALMDLGAEVCTPRSPGCLGCPWAAPCLARQRGIAAELPRRAAARDKPQRYGVVYWLERDDGAVMLRRRPENGLLGGMIEVPSTPWQDSPPDAASVARHAPVAADWRRLPGVVEHGFTHFDIDLVVLAGRVSRKEAPEGLWSPPGEFHTHALPTLTKKVVRHVLGKGSGGRPRRAQATARLLSG